VLILLCLRQQPLSFAWRGHFAGSQGCFYRLRQLWHIRQSLDSDSLATLIYAVVNSRMDYCNTVLAGAPRTVTVTLRQVFNAAVRVIAGTQKFDCGLGQILPDQLHWLDVPDQVLFKLAVTVHQCLNGRTPRICQSTASRSPVLTRGKICFPPIVIYLPHRVSGSTLTTVGRFQLLARWPGTHSRILSGIQRAAQTVLGICLKRTCSCVTSASSALGVLTNYVLYKSTHSLLPRVLISQPRFIIFECRTNCTVLSVLSHDQLLKIEIFKN